ncbi:MAG: ribonuclease P protein component [Desulfococcus sp. 4484_241]|nr:MAG: ribonuclease P protein component [Desulfococcus sp. 4484_241]
MRCVVARFSFTKSDRILKRSEFTSIAISGKTIHSDCFIAAIRENRAQKNRLGITVSKKVGKAVRRNRIKRYVREYFRLNRHKLPCCWDINVIAKKQAAQASSKEIFTSLEDLFEKTSRVISSKRR